MKPIDYETRKKLRELAKAARTVPWVTSSGSKVIEVDAHPGVICEGFTSLDEQAYVAAVHPEVVLNLLDNLEQTEKWAQEMRDYANSTAAKFHEHCAGCKHTRIEQLKARIKELESFRAKVGRCVECGTDCVAVEEQFKVHMENDAFNQTRIEELEKSNKEWSERHEQLTDACLELQAENEELKNMLGKGPYVPLHQYDLLQEQFEEIKKKNSVLVKEHKDATAYMAKKHEEYIDCIDRAYFNDDKIAELERKLEISKEALVICLKGSDVRALAAKKALEEIK